MRSPPCPKSTLSLPSLLVYLVFLVSKPALLRVFRLGRQGYLSFPLPSLFYPFLDRQRDKERQADHHPPPARLLYQPECPLQPNFSTAAPAQGSWTSSTPGTRSKTGRPRMRAASTTPAPSAITRAALLSTRRTCSSRAARTSITPLAVTI